MEDPDALQSQRHRAMCVRHLLRRHGDAYYDPEAALLRQRSRFFPRFTGHTVAQNSLEYALLLLHSDDRLYGGDDAIEANRIIRRILEHQDLRTDSESFGNFLWMTHWDRVKDRNAVSFLAPGLCHAWLECGEKLEDATRSALERAFEPMLAAVRGHGAPWRYSNIFWLNLGSLVALARVLDDEEPHAEAVVWLEEWLANTDRDGLHEFNSPTYTPVTLFGMEVAWAHTADESLRRRLRRVMDYVAYHFAANFAPNGFSAGAQARAYLRDVLWGSGLGSWWAHVKFGTPLRPDSHEPERPVLIPANFALYDYVPPDTLRGMAGRWRSEESHDQTRSLGSRRTHVMTARYSLASQRVATAGGHSAPPYVLLVRRTEHERASAAIVPDETYSRRPCPAFECCQDGGRVLGVMRYEPQEGEMERFLSDPAYVCEPRVLLGPREEIEAVRIGNVDWRREPVRLEPGQPVAVSYGDLNVGVVALPIDADGRTTPGRTWIEWGEDDELRLHVRLFGGPDVEPASSPVDALVLLDVRTTEVDDDLAEYAEWLGGWRLGLERAETGEVCIARHQDVPDLVCSTAAASPDPLGDALHRSSVMTVHPGDLLRWVNGGRNLGPLRE
ncbi:MAG: hypothetical protein ACP5KN_08895 [Armatimonadota bacterium]